METRNQEVKERLFAEFIPLDIDASVIELIIDEFSYNEDQCRKHLSTMARRGRRRNSPPMPSGGPGPAASGRRNSPAESQPGPATSGRRSSPAASQRGPAASGRQNSSPAPRAGRGDGEYSGAAARGSQIRAPPATPRQSPRRTPAPAASSDSSTPLQQKLAAGVPLLILMRGLPGSGKSTLAKKMAGQHGFVASADDFFYDRYGKYCFRPDRLRDAHDWCQNRVRQALRNGQTPVIVDNTNTQMWEMKAYVEMAAQLDYYVETAEPTTPWRHDPKLLSNRSVHSVPEKNIENMMARYEGSDRVNVPALYRMVGEKPKPWPPAGSAAVVSGATQMETAAAAVPAKAQEALPTSSPAPAPAASGTTHMDTTAAAVPAKAQEALPTPPPAPAPAPPLAPPPPSEADVITLSDMIVAVDRGWAAIGAATTQRLWSPAVAAPPTPAAFAAAAAAALERTEAGSQTDGGVDGRVVSAQPWQGAPDSQAGPPPLTVPLHRGTMTSPPPDAADSVLDSLRALFPTVDESDLQHILDQCQGDISWATNLLLDGNVESVEPAAPAREEPAAEPAAEAPVPAPSGQGARPKQPLLTRQRSEDSGPDVIVEYSSDSEDEAARPVVLQPLQRTGRPANSPAAAVDSIDDSSGSSSGESTPPLTASELSLQLPPRFAYQLQELFGPTTFGARTEAQLAALPAAELMVRLPLEVARQLHHCWLTGADRAFDAEQRTFEQLRAQVEEMSLHQREEEARQTLQTRNDEEIARQLQLEEDGQRPSPGGTATSPTPRLRDIMAEQHVQRSEQTAVPSTQADRLTRQRLREEFPGVDGCYLDELLDMHDGDYRQALRVLLGTRGERPLPTAAIRPPTPPSLAAAGAVGGGGYAGNPPSDFLVEDGMPSFDDIRAESEICRQKITHAKMMAERALRRSDFSTSQYYVDERERLYKLLNECNVRATITTMELQQGSDPNRLDLHRLLVEDAKDQLASFIADRQNSFGRQGIRSKIVEIITGKGKNSKNRKPKIKPAVEQWLQNKGFQFREADNNSGMLLVTVHSEHLYRPQN